jgi:hypothetical protein
MAPVLLDPRPALEDLFVGAPRRHRAAPAAHVADEAARDGEHERAREVNAEGAPHREREEREEAPAGGLSLEDHAPILERRAERSPEGTKKKVGSGIHFSGVSEERAPAARAMKLRRMKT